MKLPILARCSGLLALLALGGPLVLLIGLIWLAARTIRRRREDALLSRA